MPTYSNTELTTALNAGNSVKIYSGSTSIIINSAAQLPAGTSFTADILINPATQTFTDKTLIDSSNYFADDGDTSKKLQFQLSGLTTGNTRVVTVPDSNLTLVGTTLTQTLTNKTLTAPVISTISNSGTVTLPTGTVTLATLTGTETLTNKDLNSATNTIPTKPIAKVIGLNLNNAGSDNAVSIPFSNYIIRKVIVTNASTSLAASAATLGVFTATGGGGSTIVTAATLTALSSGTKFTDMTIALSADRLTASTLYIRNVLAHGSAATCDVYIMGDILI